MLAPLAILTFFCAPPVGGRVCSCIERPRLTDERAMAGEVSRFGAILDGAVLAVDSARSGVRATIAVRRHWKGSLTDTIVVHTSLAGGACGLDFKVGTRYLVFASNYPVGWFGSICSPSTIWGPEAERRAQLLGPPKSR